MDRPRLVIDRAFFVALAVITAAALLFSAGIGMSMGNDKFTPPEPSETNTAGNADPSNTAVSDPAGNTVPNTNTVPDGQTGNTVPNGNAADNTVPDGQPDNSTGSQTGPQTPGKNIGGTGTINDPGSLSEYVVQDVGVGPLEVT